MPIIINPKNANPLLPSLREHTAIDTERAEQQNIRPLEIAIINLMAEKKTTERQLAEWLGNTPLQVKLTFAATDSYVNAVRAGYEPANTPAEHIRDIYHSFSDIKNNKYDGLIITGVNAQEDRVDKEKFWPEIAEIFAWSKTNAFSSLFLCWGGKAALKYFHDIESTKATEKLWGVYPHTTPSDRTKLLFGFPDVFYLPVSRWKSPDREAIDACPSLEIIADSKEVGANILVEAAPCELASGPYAKRIYLLAHPEYETFTLNTEYLRDKEKTGATHLPAHYFPNNDPSQSPINTWRQTAILYTNWIHQIYQATPFDLKDVPRPHRCPQQSTYRSENLAF